MPILKSTDLLIFENKRSSIFRQLVKDVRTIVLEIHASEASQGNDN